VNTRSSNEPLSYAQKVFEQWCDGRASHTLLEYLNTPALREELKKNRSSLTRLMNI